MSSKHPNLPANVADALNKGRASRSHSHAELFELASDGKAVVAKTKGSNKLENARSASASDVSAAKLSATKKAVRPRSVDGSAKLSTPENVAKPKASILKTSTEKIQNSSSIAPAESEIDKTPSYQIAPENNTSVAVELETPSLKKISFTEPLETPADTDYESDSSAESSDDATVFEVKAEVHTAQLPKSVSDLPPPPPPLPAYWRKPGPAPGLDKLRAAIVELENAEKLKAEAKAIAAETVKIVEESETAQHVELEEKSKTKSSALKLESTPAETSSKPFKSDLTDIKLASSSPLSKPMYSKMSDKQCGTNYEPKPFSASETDLKARDWLDFFERYVAFKEMHDGRVCAYFGLLMRGPAEVWWNALSQSDRTNYKGLRQRFLENFANEELHKLRAATEMHTRKQGQNESVMEYYTAMVKLTKSLPAITEEVLYYLVLNGLKGHIKIRVLESDVKSLGQLLEVAKKAELAYNVLKTDDPILAAVLDELKLSRQAVEANQAEVKALGGQMSTLAAMQAISQPDKMVGLLAENKIDEKRCQCCAAQSMSQVQTNSQNWQRPSFDQNRQQNYRQDRQQSVSQTGQGNWSQQNGRGPRPQNWQQASRGQQQQQNRQIDCRNCGRTHEINNCGVKGLNCYNCGRPNHVARMCRSAPQNRNQQYVVQQGYQMAPQQ